MDNVTHSLIGLLEGQIAVRLIGSRDQARAKRLRTPLCALSMIANNAPDLDSFTLAFLTPGRLGRVLHHRGYTHTIGGIPFEAALILAGAALWMRRRATSSLRGDSRGNSRGNSIDAAGRRGPPSPALPREDWLWLIGIVVLGLALHVSADWLNSYGVHPLWPFSGRWYYGDTLFIVEPSLWMALVPFLYVETRTRWAKGVLGFIFVAALALSVFTGYVPWLACCALLAIGGASAALARLTSRRRPGLVPVLAALAGAMIIGSFAVVGRAVKADASALARAEAPAGAQLLDLVANPFPANPLCWSIAALVRSGDDYVARRGTFALAPALIKADDCPELAGLGHRARDKTGRPPRQADPTDRHLTWDDRFEGRVSRLRSLASHDCASNALLRFLRVPIWQVGNGGALALSDLRFNHGPNARAMTLDVGNDDQACPPNVPGWDYPRADLLDR